MSYVGIATSRLQLVTMRKPSKGSSNDEKETAPSKRGTRFEIVAKRVAIKRIKTAREHVEVYGARASRAETVEALAEDVRREGLRRRIPVVESANGQLRAIASVEWLDAAREAGVTHVQVDIVGTNLNRDERIVAMVRAHAGCTRTEWTRCLEAYHCFCAEKALAKERQREAGGDKVSATTRGAKKGALLSNSDKSGGTARVRAAALTGEGPSKLRMRVKLVKEAFQQSPKGPERSEIATFLGEEGGSVNAAYERFIKPRKQVAKAAGEALKAAGGDAKVDKEDKSADSGRETTKGAEGTTRTATETVMSSGLGELHAALVALEKARNVISTETTPDDQAALLLSLTRDGIVKILDIESEVPHPVLRGILGDNPPVIGRQKSLREEMRDTASRKAVRQAAKDRRTKKALLASVKGKDRAAIKRILKDKKAKVSPDGWDAILRVLINNTSARTKKR